MRHTLEGADTMGKSPLLVPKLRLGMQFKKLCFQLLQLDVNLRAPRSCDQLIGAELRQRHSQAERGNEGGVGNAPAYFG